MVNLVPRGFFSPRFPSLWDEDEDDVMVPYSSTSGLQVSEDEKNVYVEAPVPGVDPDKVEITYDKGVLWVRGNQEQEESGGAGSGSARKYYRKASSAFSYRVGVPGNIDETKEPEATYKNGVMKITFAKVPETKPKTIKVRKE